MVELLKVKQLIEGLACASCGSSVSTLNWKIIGMTCRFDVSCTGCSMIAPAPLYSNLPRFASGGRRNEVNTMACTAWTLNGLGYTVLERWCCLVNVGIPLSHRAVCRAEQARYCSGH